MEQPMNEKIRVSIPTEIPRIDESVDTNTIRQELNDYVQTIIKDVNIQDLEDWRLLISVGLYARNVIGISKRTARYPSDKEFQISISIGIPNDDQAPYGLSQVKEAFFFPSNEKYTYILNWDLEQYNDLRQYILASSKRAIDFAFTNGFTCNGKKIKFQK